MHTEYIQILTGDDPGVASVWVEKKNIFLSGDSQKLAVRRPGSLGMVSHCIDHDGCINHVNFTGGPIQDQTKHSCILGGNSQKQFFTYGVRQQIFYALNRQGVFLEVTGL